MKTKRLRATDRIAGALWGLIIAGAAVTAMYTLSGYTVDTQLVLIVGLITLGGWLLISALLSIRPRARADTGADTGAAPSGPADAASDEIGMDA